jgi:phosphatidate cytidylyltransferase
MLNFVKRIISSIVLILLLLTAINFSLVFNILLIIFFVLTIYEWLKMIKELISKLLGFFLITISFCSIYYLKYIDEEMKLIIFVLIISIATDIGGYLFGKLFKGPKLTKISPNKTIAGSIGSFVLSILSMYLILKFNIIEFEIIVNFNFINILLVILISASSQVGDIIISYYKRLYDVKDTGNIIPGHGGILDRIDGMLLSFPIFLLIVLIFNL